MGSKPDVTYPVIGIDPSIQGGAGNPGSYIRDKATIYVKVNDDSGIINSVTANITYYVMVDPETGIKAERKATIPARYDEASGKYMVDVDTWKGGPNPNPGAEPAEVPMADGRLSVEITAVDGSGKKTATPPMVYWIDNTPPMVEMQVPRPKYKDAYTIDVDNPPLVVAGSPLAGLISDDQGIARGYPLIKFWRADNPEPLHDHENAGMPAVINGDWHGEDDGWIRPDKGYLPPDGPDEKPIAMAFMYYTANHHENGKPFSEQPDEVYRLDPNVRYKLKIKVADLGGHEILWPPQRSGTENETGKYDLDHIVVFLDTTGNPPLIEITTDPEGQFQRQNFTIKAHAESRDQAEDIASMNIRVAGKKKDGMTTGWVPLKSVANTGPNTASSLEFTVEYGKTYTNQSEFPDLTKDEWENHPDSVSVTFKDGSFQFEASAVTTGSGSRGRELLSVYLDQQPPQVAFTQVDPYFDMRDIPGIAGDEGYRSFTVNGTIKVKVSSTDNRGNAVIDGTEVPKADDQFAGFERFKYLLSKDAGISPAAGKTLAETIYEHTAARFFEDHSGNNSAVTVTGSDGAYTLQIQTDEYDDAIGVDDKEYNLWLYIAAQDNTKNMSCARILLDVNQETDNPVITYGNLSDLGTSFSNETLTIQVTVKDDDGFNESIVNNIRYATKGEAASPPVQYRYNKDAGTNKTDPVAGDNPNWVLVGSTGTTWYTLPDEKMYLSADNKTITIDLSVQEILPNIFGKDWDTVYNGKDPDGKRVQDYYGSENVLKAIEFRSYDAANRKVLPGDGTAMSTATRKFTVDFTWPEIVRLDPVNKPRDWFLKPGANEAFKESFLANGHLREMYFKSFQVVIDGSITLTIPPPGVSPGDPWSEVPPYDAWNSSDKKTPMVVKAQDWTSTDPKLQWFFPMDYDDPSDSPDKGPLWDQLAEGPHIFQLTLTDWAGNAERQQVSFYKDGVGPVIGFNNLNQIEENGTRQYPRLSDTEWRYWGDPVANAGLLNSAEQTALKDKMKALSALNDQTARLMGTFTDEYSNVGTTYWWKLEKFVAKAYDPLGPDKKFWDTGADSGKGGWVNAEKWNDANLTPGGNKNEAFAIAIPNNEYDPVTNEVITDNDGLYRVSIRVQDSKENGFTNIVNPGSGNPIGLGYEENVAFSVDRIPPEVKITKVTFGADTTDRKDEAGLVISPAGITGNVITITGTANDAFLDNGEATAIIRNSSNNIILGSADSYGSDKIDIHLSDGAGSNEDIWTIALTRAQFDTYMNADGAYTLAVTFKDGGSREGTKTWTFIRDGKPPEITFNNLTKASTNTDPARAILSEMNPRIQGLASDANLIKGLKYRLEKNTNTHAAPVWTAVTETGKTPDANGFVDFDAAVTGVLTGGGAAYINWSRSMDIPASNLGGDGEYRVAVYARDNALLTGNESLNPASLGDTGWIYFVVDRAPPVLTVADTLAYYGSAGINLSGTASDASGLKPLGAFVKGFESSAPAPVTVNEATGVWNIHIDTSTHSGIGGAQTLVVRVEDNVGHSVEVTRNFIYDAMPPYVVIDEPRTRASIGPGKYNTQGAVNGGIILRGRTDDDSSVARILYHIGEKVTAPRTDSVNNISNVFQVKASEVIAHPGGENAYKILTKGDTDWTLLGAPAGYDVGTIFTPSANGSTLPPVTTEGTAELWIDTLLDSRDHPNWDGTLYSFTRTFPDFNIYGSSAFSNTELGVDTDGYYTEGTTVEPPSPANPNGMNRWKVPVYFKIIDLAGNEWDFGGDSGSAGVIDTETRPGINPIEKDYWIIVDRYLDKPTVNLISPISGSRVGGQQRLSGTAKDDDYVFQVEYRLNGQPASLVSGFPPDNDPGWAKYPSDSGVPAFAGQPVPSNGYGPDGTTPLSGGWRVAGLPSAGMQASWWVNINSGGEYSSSAGQDRNVYIQIRAMDTKDPSGSGPLNARYGDTANYTLTFDSGVPVISTPRIKWYDDHDPSLPGTHLVGEGDYSAQMQVSRTFVLEADVKDEGGLKEFRWQQTAVAGNPDILNSTVSGKTAVISLPPVVKEGNSLKVGYKYFIKTEGTTDWSAYATGGIDPTTKVFTASVTGPVSGTGEAYEADTSGSAGYFVYKLRMELDTLSSDVANGLYNNYGTGVYQLTLSATDNSNPSNTTKLTLDFQVDNSYPTVRYENSTTVVGSEYYIQGYASDIPPAGKGNISKMAGVTVYFQKRKGDSSNFLNTAEQGGSLSASNGAIIDLKGNVVPKSVLKDFRVRHVSSTSTAGVLEAVPSLIKMPPTWFEANGTSTGTAKNGDAKYAITIDQEEIYGGTMDSVDHDGYHESWHPEGQEQFWQVLFNSLDLPDGPLTMHFIAQDAAGNASHRTIDLIIKNKVPHLYDLELGTSLYNSSINPDANMAWDDIDPSAYGASLFTVRNNRLDLKASVSNGNVRNRYRVSYMEQKGPVGANTIKAGNVYTIAVNTGANFMNIGASSNTPGTTFMATIGGENLSPAATVYYYEAPVNPVITVSTGTTLTGGTQYVIDYPGNTNWISVGAGAGPWLAGQVFTANANSAVLVDPASPGSAGTAYPVSTVTVQTGILGGYVENMNPGDKLNVSFDNLKKAGTFGAAGIPDKDNGYFLIKVFDTTDPASTTPEGGQLADYILLRLDIENTDSSAPEGKFYDLNPYARNMTTGANLNDNSGTANWGPSSIGGNRNLGGLFYTGTGTARQISGHIEPRFTADGNSAFIEDNRNTNFTVDTVSGKVILRGYAKDNQRIAEIGVRIGGTGYQTGGAYVKILETDTATGRLKAAVDPNTPVGSVRVFDTLTLAGHEAEWAYIWDSAALPGTVVGTASLAVEVKDAKASAPNANTDWPWAASVQADEASNRNRTYNRITVDRAPYILDIVRVGRSTTRSKQGWFSLRQDSPDDGDTTPENLWIMGFNLATGTRTTNMTTTVRFGADAAAQAGTLTAEAPGQIALHLPGETRSGDIYLRAGGTTLAVNNRNENLNSWNVEGTETLPWTDNRGAHIWMSYGSLPGTDNGYFRGSENPKFPAMTINPADGKLWASWSQDGGEGGLWRGSNTSAADLIFTSYDPMEYTDIAYSDKAGPAISFLANISIALPPASFGDSSGGLYLHDTANNNGINGYYGSLRASTGAINGTELLVHNSSLMQFRNPRLIINAADEHLAYYDNVTNSMKYWYHLAGNSISRLSYAGTPIRTWINIDGATDAEDTAASTATVAYTNTSNSVHYVRSVAASGTIAAGARLYQVRTASSDTGGTLITEVFNDTGAAIAWTRVSSDATVNARATSGVLGRIALAANSRVVPDVNYEDSLSRVTTGSLAGQYSAIDYTSDGCPVIAYSIFTGANTEVRLAYANGKNPVLGSQWKVQRVLAATDVNHGTAGEYISMRINRNSGADKDRIHIAFASTNGALIYVTGTRDSSTGKYTFTPSVPLDENMVGRWTDLTLDASGKPFISYLDNIRLGTANGLKMAFFNAADTGYTNLDKWETMNMPGLFAVKETRTSIEYDINDKRTKWAAAVGYESSEGLYRIAYYVK